MSAVYGCCGMPKQWSRNGHADFCLYGPVESKKHHPTSRPELPDWYRERYVVDDHDARYEELAGK